MMMRMRMRMLFDLIKRVYAVVGVREERELVMELASGEI